MKGFLKSTAQALLPRSHFERHPEFVRLVTALAQKP